MKIITQTGYVFDLPEDFDAGFSRYNSILSDTGDQTLPMTLPATDETKKYFSYSHRIDNWFKPVIDHEVIVSDGVISKRATLSLNSLDFSEGIPCTIYFGNGDFYSRIDKKKLSSLNWDTVKHPDYDNVNIDFRRQYLIDLCKECQKDPAYSDRYGVVPALTTTEYTIRAGVINDDHTTYSTEDISGLFIMNGPERFRQNDGNILPRFSNMEGSYSDQTYVQNGNAIEIKKGYGLSPFLKLSYILEVLFSTYGYTVDMSDYINFWTPKLPSDPLFWKKIVLGNPVADAIYGGKLEEKQLVPNVYIADFLLEVSKLLAGKFVIDEVNKIAVFKMYQSVIVETPSGSIDQYASSNEKMEIPSFKTIVLSDGTETDDEETDNTIEKISFSLVNRAQVSLVVNELVRDWWTGVYENTKITKTMYLANMDVAVVHKNSAIVVDGKIQTDDDNEFSDIRFINHSVAEVYDTSNWLFKSHVSVGVFTASALAQAYANYILFRKNSNIPGTVDLTLPRSIFYSQDLSVPVLYKNQPILIQQFEGSLTADPVEAKATFTTLRDYI